METTLPVARRRGAPPPVVSYAWFTLGWTLITIVLGAVVRATHSGDGCGASWPSCDGQFFVTAQTETPRLIEFTHRSVSGLNLLFVAGLLMLVFRSLPVRHRARRTAVWSMISILIEAGLGALIVLYGWVSRDTSTPRQISVPLHLVNTLALTGLIALLVWQLRGGGTLTFARSRGARALAGLATLLVLVAATGATTSLADTLFEPESLGHGLAQDLDSSSALIVRLRVLHPLIAIVTGIVMASYVWRRLDDGVGTRPGQVVLVLLAVQAGLGSLHIVLLTPLATALMHLAVAQTLWVAFAFFAFDRLEVRDPGGLSLD
ncbi:MAG: heme A synthase [Dehalococcoidia bacterium]|nr:MAG: heme A synthase [Dehalococcoidia bacterium]